VRSGSLGLVELLHLQRGLRAGVGAHASPFRLPKSDAGLTLTVWNWTYPQFASFGWLSGLRGSFLPFARTRA
jgi:hypothetical protein